MLLLPINEQWFSFLYGYLSPLLYPNAWIGTPEQQAAAVDNIRKVMDYMTVPCDPCGITVQIGINGEIQLVLSPTLTVSAQTPYIHDPTLSGNDWQFYIGDQQNTLNIAGDANNIWQPPPTPTPNQYCYAAHFIVENFSDELQDILQVIDVGLNEASQTLQLLGVVPVAGSIAETVIEFLHEGLIQPALDWALANIFDIDAQFTAKEALYCAIIESFPNLNTVWDYVDFPPSLPEILFNVVTEPAEWQNVKDILTWGYNVGTGEEMGWIVLRYIQFIDVVLGQKLGLTDPMKTMVARAMHASTLYNQPDCQFFDCIQAPLPFELQIDWNGYATQLNWHVVPGELGVWYDQAGAQGWTGQKNPSFPYDECRVECLEFTLNGTIETLDWKIGSVLGSGGVDTWIEIWAGGVKVYDSGVKTQTGTTLFFNDLPNYTGNHSPMRMMIAFNNAPDTNNKLLEYIYITGTGVLTQVGFPP